MDLASADYSAPTRECDIIMKGGITSGVVYPHAICELAQTYRFKQVGGTSAGAIAAAATAAAESAIWLSPGPRAAATTARRRCAGPP